MVVQLNGHSLRSHPPSSLFVRPARVSHHPHSAVNFVQSLAPAHWRRSIGPSAVGTRTPEPGRRLSLVRVLSDATAATHSALSPSVGAPSSGRQLPEFILG
ncbi:unnamed protein product [Citrullus colocynthis]|uniref:Uncharacterized protein n=1 Tax=Citrullus colocynthis TaxID=252529 RepID=A0ABP0XUS0_9ROSI